MWVFLRNANLPSVWSEIRRAQPKLLIAALGAVALSHGARVRRWQQLLAPLGAVGFASAARATIIGFATTAILPGRLGEVLRPYLLARREQLSVSATLATIVLERVMDLITVVLLLGIFLVGFADGLPQGSRPMLSGLKVGGAFAAAGAVTALAVIALAAGNPDRAGRLVARLVRVLPDRVGGFAEQTMVAFSRGLGLARQPGRLVRAFVWSFPVWLCVAGSAWAVCHAFGIDLPLSGSLVLMVMMVLGVAVPTPAGAGGFHAAFQVGATGFYEAPLEAAVGAALVLHGLSFGPIALLGLVWMVRDGVTLRGAADLAASSRAHNEARVEEVSVRRGMMSGLTEVATDGQSPDEGAA